ncbi:multidrug resistance-associated protein [Aspergillus campestris IBT 28561]|uniref:Multidrug resistance-associated protein n=1 Tax=Aspergillus campestris (strain IBT 28561) TaxID=1392248 RepID=A0A2I1DCH0_ASPC2|nr:multidrug resistance-associated protein [Aspergillus campestris IBT 28561]PKY07569.1 multidrug resistance-associated protein [Aspergillus campestris IBT 28561]
MVVQSPSPLFCQEVDNALRVPASSCRGGFDFSLLFEEIILGIVPLAIVLIIVPFRLWHLARKPRKVEVSWLLWAKVATWIALTFAQAALVALWSLPSSIRTRASIATNSATTAGVFLLGFLSYAEHNLSVKPSLLLNLYLFCSLLFDGAKVRTLWLRNLGGMNHTITILTSAALGVKLLLFILEAVEKRSVLKSKYSKYPPEATSGVFNKFFFWWLIPVFRAGFSRILAIDDLFTLEKKLNSKRLSDTLETSWKKVETKSPNSLFFVTLKAFKWQILSGVAPRACLVALNLCQPLLLHRSLSFSTEPVNQDTDNVGYGLIGAYALVYTGLAITMGQYQHSTYRAIAMVRGALVSMVYNKATGLDVKEADPASSLTLMSADVERIVQGWQTMHDMWANVIEMGLAIYLLEQQLGLACVVPVGVSVVALVGSMIGLTFVMARQAQWLEAIERRISSTASMLSSIKGVKMLGLTPTMMHLVHNLRIDELNISKKFRTLLVWNMGFAWLTRIFAPIVAFGAFVGISHDDAALNTSVVYTSLSLFTLLSDPLLTLVMALMSFVGSVGSFARIQEFLDKESHVDSRKNASTPQLDLFQEQKTKRFAFVDDAETLTNSSHSRKSSEIQSSHSLYNSITIQNAAFGWDVSKDPLLKNLTVTVGRGNLVMLIGPSGCGKSTLVKALLGEVPCLSGNISVSSERIAYCDQVPWHINASIRDSITAMSSFDSGWYTSVIRACALVEDFDQLPRGDQTIIGSQGISLSGGQSQRIALARAVYARREIIILDDVLSGLDATTEDHVFHHLIGVHGLLRSVGSTVILASSSVKRVPYADHIVVLDTDGFITEQGTFKALDSAGGYVSSFSLASPEWKFEGKPRAIKEKSDVKTTTVEAKEMVIDEHGSSGDLSIYLYYARSIGWLPTITFIVAISGFVFCISFPSLWVKLWASANEREPGVHTAYYLGIYAMLGAVAMLSLMAGCWQMFIHMVPKSGEVFHRNLLSTVLGAPMSFFSAIDSGAILNRFSQDLQLIDMELPAAAINTFTTLVLCISQMVFIGIGSKYAAASFPVVIGVLYAVQKVYLRTSRQLRFLDLEAKTPLFSHFSDCLGGLITLRAFGWQRPLQEKNQELLDRSQRPFYLLYAVQRWLTITLDMVVAAIAVLLAVLVVVMRGTISSGYVGVALLNVIMFSQSIKLLVTFWTNLETHIGSILRVRTFTEKVSSENLPEETDDVPHEWPSQGQIEITNVSAQYRSSEPVLQDVSLSIKEGEKVAICGRTGSGKTSLVMSIFRMLDLSTGSISIDGTDISKIPRQTVRSRLNGVSQSPLLMKGTVRRNADPTGSITDTDIWNAFKSVQLYSIVQEKGGLDADIDELFLSHGQKQLFCLARAILRSGKILVLDEATSNVDAKTDEILQRVIRGKFAAHTILAVAHKLDTILDYDTVVVLEAGRVVESGNPFDLLSSDESYFARLYASSVADELD